MKDTKIFFYDPDPFLGITNDREGKEDADDPADNVADERCEEGDAVRVVRHHLCETVSKLYTFHSPNYTE